MLIEAVLLYIRVKNLSRINSKQSEVLGWTYMAVLGYVIPLTAVGMTSGLNPGGFGNEK